ncbi:hypothetical protein BCR44DRAFT_76233 [Catenaria anguillulae PL171]|uniref:Integral membrane protein n=1 Tax=Catenaria anguillulae PL171 TaxID=765915 RepID=A0A1Y2HAV0_9FUNG|nr:hypothetical protein BCR44DRAFT_76233 [Catenaria anguillulae PL171]
MNQESPLAAWIATVLCASSLPLCAYPPLAIWREQRRKAKKSRNTTSTRFSIALWMIVCASHIVLITFSAVTATEIVCGNGSRTDFGWTAGHYSCMRRRIENILDLLEYCTVPFYPLTILSISLQLRPNQRTRHFLKIMYRYFAGGIGILTLILLFAAVADGVLTWTHDLKYIVLAELADSIFDAVFTVWFAALITCAMCSLVLAVRLIPYIEPTKQRPRLNTSTPILSWIRAGSVRSQSSDHHQATTSSQSSLGPPLHSPQQAGGANGDRKVPAASPTVGAVHQPSAASTTVHKCVLKLKVLVVLIALVLAGDVAMVAMGDSVPRVLMTVLGWLSCRIVSVSLFAAVNQIKRAVIAKRRVPNPAVGSLATNSEWNGSNIK